MNKRYRLGDIEEAISEMEELIDIEDDIAEIDDEFQIVVSGWSVYVESLNLTLRQMLLRQEKHRRQSRKRQGRSCQKSGKIKPDKFRGVGVKSCVLFICLKQFMIWRMFQEITRMD